jgi:aconitate hydratase
MTRGTFANVRIKNLMLGGKEGGNTLSSRTARDLDLRRRREAYQAKGVPLIVIAGQEYGTGSSPRLGRQGHQPPRREGRRGAELRAHPPLQPRRHGRAAPAVQGGHDGADAQARRLRDLRCRRPHRRDQAAAGPHAQDHAQGRLGRERGRSRCRIDTPIEIDYYQHGGILPYVLRQIVAAN